MVENQTHVTPQTQLHPKMIWGMANRPSTARCGDGGQMQEGRRAEDTVRKQSPDTTRGDRLHRHLQPWGCALGRGVSLMSAFENQQGLTSEALKIRGLNLGEPAGERNGHSTLKEPAD